MKKPDCGGLSGEHIQLCAEGARQRPNLSGKRTETQDAYNCAEQSLCGLLFVLFENLKEVIDYVRQTH